jgi:hypothetical protein
MRGRLHCAAHPSRLKPDSTADREPSTGSTCTTIFDGLSLKSKPVKIFSHIVWIIFCTVLLAASFPTQAEARTELRSIAAGDQKSITFFFSALPPSVSSELSDDKKRIILRIPDATVTEKAREATPLSDAAIELVSVQQNGNALTIYITLREKYGFTQAPLPYSQALRLYVVDWEDLNQKENLFHSGLLSLDSKLSSTAREYFRKASQAGMGDAAAMSGLSLLMDGKPEEAQGEFTRAIDLGTSIHDVYAAVSDIAAARGDAERAKHFAELYTRKTRRNSFPTLVGPILPETTNFTEPPTIAQNLLTDEQPVVDSTSAATPEADSLLNEKVSAQARSLMADTTALQSTTPISSGTSLVPTWMRWMVYGILLFFGIGMAGLVYLYMRWRKKQMAQSAPMAAQEPSTFDKEVSNALQSVTARKAAAMYARSEQETTEQEQPAQPQAEEVEIPQPPAFSDTEHRFSPDDIISHPAPEPQTFAVDDVDALARKLRKGRGELDLAVKLLARKKQDGKDRALALKAEEIPQKPTQLSRLARDLGVGTGTLEIRRNLETLGEQEREEKLRSLFGGKRRDA